jgi:hypothetical protein
MNNLLKNEFLFQMFNSNIKFSKLNFMVHASRGLSHNIVSNLLDNTFDIIYIIGAHDYVSVKNDIQSYKPQLVINGILCRDGYELALNEVGNMKIQTYVNTQNDPCLDSKIGLYYHLGITTVL